MRDAEFLDWLADRIVESYHESPNVDFVLRLRRMAAEVKVREHAAEPPVRSAAVEKAALALNTVRTYGIDRVDAVVKAAEKHLADFFESKEQS